MQSVWGYVAPLIAQSHMLSEALNGAMRDVIQTDARLLGKG